MKKILTAGTAMILSAGFVFASGIENKSNLSVGALRNLSRNIECERPEAAFYNIAGTTFLKDGFYVELGNQFVIKEYSNTLKTGTPLDYKATDNTPVLLYPNADIVFKQDKLAVFGTFGIYAGGGSLSYKDGTSVTTAAMLSGAQTASSAASQYAAAGDAVNAAKYGALASGLNAAAPKGGHSLDVTSITYGGQIGASYQVIENLSIGLAGRFVYGTQDMAIKSNALAALGAGKISYEASGFAFSGVAGIQYRVLPELDISLQYQSISSIEYEVENVKGGEVAAQFGVKDGAKFHTDIPSVLGLGVGYRPIDPLYLSLSGNYYFNVNAHQDSVLGKTDYDNSWDVSLGADYRINEILSVSLSGNYACQGITENDNSAFNPVLDCAAVAGGVEITPTEMVTVTIGCLYVKYFDETYKKSIELQKEVFNTGLGLTFKF